MSAKDETEHTELDVAITRVLAHMADAKCDSEEYAKLLDHLSKLYKMKDTEASLRKDAVMSRRVSPDTLAIVAANLVGIVLIIGHERANVIATKALSLVTKLR